MPATKSATSEAVPGLFRAKHSFAFHTGDTPHMVKKGDVVRAGDPVLKGRDELFEAFVPVVRDFSKKA